MHTARKQQEEQAAAEIMHLFRFYYRDQWAPGHLFDKKHRVWVSVFNSLVAQGYIERKKTVLGFQYRWTAAFPEGL